MRWFMQTSAAWLAGLALVVVPSVAQADDVVVLFDGSSFDAWRGYNREGVPEQWTIEDGALAFNGKGGGDLMTKEKFDDYEFSFEWKISPGGNSGVIWGVKEIEGKPSYWNGPEYQVLDDGPNGNHTVHGAGALYDLYPPVGKEVKPAGEWNTGKVVRKGSRVEHWVNGAKVVDVDLDSDEFKQKIAASKFATWDGFAQQKPGHIALQDHGDPVWYRNIQVKRLSAE